VILKEDARVIRFRSVPSTPPHFAAKMVSHFPSSKKKRKKKGRFNGLLKPSQISTMVPVDWIFCMGYPSFLLAMPASSA
jgi:hypothetical protein